MDFSINFYAYLFVFLLIPCFSSCLHTLPCNKSIIIKPPFYSNETNDKSCHGKTKTTNDKSCPGKIKTTCVNNIPKVYPFNNNSTMGFQIESISYGNNTMVIQDTDAAHSLLNSSCDSFLFNISVNFYNYSNYFYFSKTLSSYKCDSTSNAKVYIQYEKFHHGCSSSSPTNASFEWTLSFTNESGELTAELARFTSFLSDCSDPGPKSRGKDTLKTPLTIIAAVSGGLVIIFTIIASCFCILYFKHNKWKWVSYSSKLLINRNRNLSDPYKNDLELVGSQYTHIFTYEELEEATDAFNSKNELGGGGFGIVYKGKLRDGKIVAVKRLFKNSYKRVEQFMNEVEILSNLHHPNLVTLYGCTACTSHELLLVYEYVPNGTVADHLHGPRVGDHSLTWPLRLNIAIETAQALTFLHSIEPQIIHRDVKTNNILLDEGFHVKVGDFGLSRLVPLDMTHVSTMPQGTPGYVDPVFHQCYQLTEKSDVYSFGVVLIELISSKPAVDMSRSSNEINLADLALNKIQRSELSELVDPAFEYEKDWEMRRMVSLVAELAFRCLQGEREMRPTIKEALEVFLVVQKEGFGNKNKGDKDNNGEKVKEDSETCLLRDGAVYSPDTVVERWTSRSMTSNASV